MKVTDAALKEGSLYSNLSDAFNGPHLNKRIDCVLDSLRFFANDRLLGISKTGYHFLFALYTLGGSGSAAKELVEWKLQKEVEKRKKEAPEEPGGPTIFVIAAILFGLLTAFLLRPGWVQAHADVMQFVVIAELVILGIVLGISMGGFLGAVLGFAAGGFLSYLLDELLPGKDYLILAIEAGLLALAMLLTAISAIDDQRKYKKRHDEILEWKKECEALHETLATRAENCKRIIDLYEECKNCKTIMSHSGYGYGTGKNFDEILEELAGGITITKTKYTEDEDGNHNVKSREVRDVTKIEFLSSVRKGLDYITDTQKKYTELAEEVKKLYEAV